MTTAVRAVAALLAVTTAGGCSDGSRRGGTPTPAATATGTVAPSDTPTTTATPFPTRTATVTLTSTATVTRTETPAAEWATYGQNQSRTFFNASEHRITRDNAGGLRFKWRYLTGAVVTAGPAVAYVDVPAEGRVKTVIVPSWDGKVYALRAANGSRLWSFAMKPHPGGSYPYAASAEVATVAGEQRVYVAGGMTVYCLAAATGEKRWEFDAGTGCTTCDSRTERNEIESSPTVVGDLVYFAMDVNDTYPGKGGAYAVDATDGHLVWYFDVDTAATCRPLASDRVYHFDGFHSTAELGLPEDFFATRPGCDFDRGWTACGNIWSSFAVDYERRLIYVASSNCDTDDDPETPEPPPPMPPYDEALFALTFEGEPVWRWRPREIDNVDLAFGGVPNLFEVEIGGTRREVVGVGDKSGTYYLLDRDGVNALTGKIEPYWQQKVVEGGSLGGIIASAAAGDGKVFFSTAIGISLSKPQLPAAHALSATDGSVVWQNPVAPPSFSPTTAIPGVVFMGSLTGALYAYDADTGQILGAFTLGLTIGSPATVADGEVFVGDGIGMRGIPPDDPAFQNSNIPSYITAFCLPDASDCPAALCDDGDPCTYNFHGPAGCQSEPAPDGIPCEVEAQAGTCGSGMCNLEGIP